MEVRFGLSQTDLLLCKDTLLSADERKELENIVQRLLQREPVQYILGQEVFCGHVFHVEPGVLIPRPETAELVRWVAEAVPSGVSLLDIGTGSGCIAISLALMGYEATAMDVSPDALRIAQGNADALGARVDFVLQDILHPSPTDRQWDVIVSNPPYVCQSEAADMEDNVLLHEPSLALFVPDQDPLLFYRSIALYGLDHLLPGGWLFFEINRAYARETADMLGGYGYQQVVCRQDQFGNPRMVCARRNLNEQS